MSWEDIIKTSPYQLRDFIKNSEEILNQFKDEADYFYSKQTDPALVDLLDEANNFYEKLRNIIYDMEDFLEVVEQNETIVRERLQ